MLVEEYLDFAQDFVLRGQPVHIDADGTYEFEIVVIARGIRR